VAAEIVQGDVRQEESAVRAIQTIQNRFGRLDILVNGAAGNFMSTAESLSLNAFKVLPLLLR